MRAFDELVARLAERRAHKIDGLSPAGFQELEAAVRADPETFVDGADDEAFALLCTALERYEGSFSGDEFMDDEEFRRTRKARLSRLGTDCEQALALDPTCIDAQHCAVLAQDLQGDDLLDALLSVDAHLPQDAPAHDLWGDVRQRPLLRLHAQIARTYLDTARYTRARIEAENTMALSPSDVVGARHTAALALARLENEDGLEELDKRYARQNDAWEHLARVIVLFKLGRMGAARRALQGFSRVCEGGAYALLRPIWHELYIPDRPEAAPLSFEAATMAVFEADPIIVDTPDLPAWAESQESILADAQRFANSRGFDF